MFIKGFNFFVGKNWVLSTTSKAHHSTTPSSLRLVISHVFAEIVVISQCGSCVHLFLLPWVLERDI